jgi:uncharacterized protein YyaL (SSP411 family)
MTLQRRLIAAVFALLACPVGALQNQLIEHPSPYLAMHGEDPVAWQDWGEGAVALARETGKLLFVSSGYFSCHWCHVMQRESYRDPEIAAQLNRHFIPVKLDRELHSALDAFLIDYVEQTTGQAGWPLNVFLTPEGYPLIGATYLPPDRFNELLLRIHRVWTDERGRMRNLARRTLLQLQLNETEGLAEPLSATLLRQRLLQDTLQIADSMQGGFGEQSRFPMAPQLLALLDLQHASPDPRLAEFLTLTLDQMAQRGLRDHLGGGFFRYTVDPGWLVPHFEKMLYTQALLAEVFMRAADVFGRDDYAEVARDTLHFVAREMRGPLGGYVASFSAVDGAGREGAVYLWAIEDLHRVLGERDTALARRYWAMLDIPPFDFGHLPMRGESIERMAALLDYDASELEERLHDVRLTLLTERAKRELPLDHKELAGWNGLMLAAFSKAARRWNDPVFDYAAERIHGFVTQTLWSGTSLHRAVRLQADGGTEPVGSASLADYAYVAYGISEYARLRGDPSDQTFVAALLSLAWQRFHGPGGWRMDDQALIPGMSEQAAMREGALPAPSSLLMQLAATSPSPNLSERGVAAAEYGRAQAQAAPFWYAGHLSTLLEIAARQRPEGFVSTLPMTATYHLPQSAPDVIGRDDAAE